MLRIETSQELMMVFLIGEIDHHCAGELREEIDRVAERVRPKTMILDLSDVGFMDSSGIAVVVQSARQMRALGGDMAVSGVSKQAMRVFSAAGIPKLVRFTEGGENR